MVDTTGDGAILLRPAAVYPIEIYSDERIRDFDESDRMDPATAARLARAIGKKSLQLFLDASVVFSAAHNPQGNARALLRLAAVRGATLVASSFAVEEAVRGINLKFPEYAVELTALLERLVLGP